MSGKVAIPAFPHLPSRIARLSELAYNFWWNWQADSRALFRRLDLTLWRRSSHNPVLMLQQISEQTLQARAQDAAFLALYDSVTSRFDDYLSRRRTWFASHYAEAHDWQLAYFCAEFGMHSSLPIYSGGLGLLSGDIVKESSDLGIPLAGIGFLYPQGYFRQHITPEGRQEALYECLNTDHAPILPVLQNDGGRLLVPLPVGSHQVKAAVWKLQVGRVSIYLMDTDVPDNEPWARDLSSRLYGGDLRTRLQQEIVLGMGGLRVLRALGHHPSVTHLNEGHAAFAGLERLREEVERGCTFAEALEEVRANTVFTTHTPVQAGHDVFPFSLIEEYFQGFWDQLGISREQFLGLGQTRDGNSFCMTILALRLAGGCNGVSRKHGEVSRHMWHFLWPEKNVDAVPILSITNGVHIPSWVAPELARLYDRCLGQDWMENHDDPALWERIFEIPDEDLWETHLRLKNKMLNFIRERVRIKWIKQASSSQVVALGGLLSPHALTIGFARRFATYKRAALILQDRQRLKRILHNPWKPVQVIFAGKAHPADEPGKNLIQEVYRCCCAPDMGGHVAFVEDYDAHVAHYLVTGVDVWLNNPRPPQEASGTSGQKAALNGIPNCSVLDGWWQEGYNGKNGWAIEEEEHADDAAVAGALYDLLEKEIVPLFYDRDSGGVAQGWVQRMKEAIRSAAAPFSARRMLKEYTRRMYRPSSVYAAPAPHEKVGRGVAP